MLLSKTLMNYMTVTDTFNTPPGMGNEIILHISIMGGQDLGDTMGTLRDIVDDTPEAIVVPVRTNQNHGVVESGGKSFKRLESYVETESRIRSIASFPRGGRICSRTYRRCRGAGDVWRAKGCRISRCPAGIPHPLNEKNAAPNERRILVEHCINSSIASIYW